MPQVGAGLWAGIKAFVAWKGITAVIVKTILYTVAMNKVNKVLAKRARTLVPPINVTVRSTIENRRIVLGTRRVGGALVFYGASGDRNQFLWYVIAYAGHQCYRSRDHWVDATKVADGAINGGAAEGGAVTTGQFANKLWIYKHLGDSSQGADLNLDLAFDVWTPQHRLRGICHSVIKMERDETKYPNGAPESVSALLDGALLYDQRKDSTVPGGSGTHRKTDPRTWEFGASGDVGRNPGLQVYWYLTGGSVHNDQATRLMRYGPQIPAARIPDSYVIAAANRCDETLSGGNAPPSGSQPRYRCDIEVSTGETRREIIEHILMSMAGSVIPTKGELRIHAGGYDTPTHSFSELDLYDELEVEDSTEHRRRYNQVTAIFADAGKDYIEQPCPLRTDASYVTQDGSREKLLELDLRGVTNVYQAQRLCEIKLRQSRMMRTVKLVGALNLLPVACHETLTYSHSRFAWTSRIFRCVERQFEYLADAGRVVLTCDREDPGVWTDMVTADYETGTSDTDVFTTDTPDPPASINTTGGEGTIIVQWGKPAIVYPGTSYELQESSSASMSSPTTIYQGPDLQVVLTKTTTANFYYRVRAVRNGGVSSWVPAGDGVLGKVASLSNALSATVSPGAASSSSGSASQTTNSVTVTPSGGTSPYTYAWTWASGGTSITIDSPTAATTAFSATGLGSGETRSGQARCTVTDNVSATYTIDVTVTITRPAPTVDAIGIGLFSTKIQPTDATVAFTYDADGIVYTSVTAAAPATARGNWVTPAEYAGDYEIRITRTGGSETDFTSGPALNTWHALTADRTWRLTESADGSASRNILFTIEIRRASDSVVVDTQTGNECQVVVEA